MNLQLRCALVCAGLTLPAVACLPSYAVELISNGGFETTDLTGWTLVDAGLGTVEVTSLLAPPNSLYTTPGPASGMYYAVTYQDGPGTHAILQSFTVPGPAASVMLSYDMFVQTQGPETVDPVGLDHSGPSNQHARVDILSNAATPLDTGAGVLDNYYLGIDGPPTQAYTSYQFDITPLVGAGGTYQLRFAQTDNLGNFNLGVDNVSIDFTPVPEPASVVLAALLGGGVACLRRRRTPCV
jgi:hypothetical protein